MRKLLLTVMFYAFHLISYSYDITVDRNSYDIISVSDRTVEIMQLADYNNPTIPPKIVYNGIEFDVIGIGEECFKGTSITSFEIPHFITQIGLSAFSDCQNLTSFTIPKTITLNAGNTFARCSNLEEIIINADIPALGMEYKGAVGSGFASYCTSLKKVKLPDNLISIDADFIGCTALEQIVFPQTLRALDPSAFAGCTKLDNIVFPQNVNWISNKAFAECDNLINIEVRSEEPPTIFDDTFPKLIFLNGKLTIPMGALEKYKSHPIWGEFLNIRESEISEIASTTINDEVEIIVSEHNIFIKGKDINSQVEVTAMNGQTIYCGYDSVINVNHRGIVVIRVLNRFYKVMI